MWYWGFKLRLIREVVWFFLVAHGRHGTHGIPRGEEKDFVFCRVSVSSVSAVDLPPEKISSLQNPRVKQLVKLRDRRPRDEARYRYEVYWCDGGLRVYEQHEVRDAVHEVSRVARAGSAEAEGER